jgi:hypothetical protein
MRPYSASVRTRISCFARIVGIFVLVLTPLAAGRAQELKKPSMRSIIPNSATRLGIHVTRPLVGSQQQ